MGKIKVALCDTNLFYGERFSMYMMKHKSEEIALHVYTREEELVRALEKGSYDVILAGLGFHTFFENRDMGNNVLYLTEELPDKVAEETAWQDGTPNGRTEISRFLSMEYMMHEIYVAAQGGRQEKNRYRHYQKIEITGVCSPIRHELQSLFSVLYAVNCGREKKVLYLSFLEYSGFGELFEREGDKNLGDLILRLRQGNLDEDFFWRCIYEMKGIFFAFPFENPENLMQIRKEDFEKLMDYLEKYTEFEQVIIDFGMMMPEYAFYLDCCSRIYMLGKEGHFYECQKQAFIKWIAAQDEKLPEKIQQVQPAYSVKNLSFGGNLIEQLQWSEFGDFVRNVTNGKMTREE